MSPEEKKTEKSQIAEREEEILEFWRKNKIFEKSEGKESPEGDFVFYDGPPFATGLPHYGHILAGTIKDAIPRYQSMKGKRVFRRWGWDCHGLPLENQIEQELGIKSKKQIEELGVDKFNEEARGRVLKYADDWKKIVPRLGRWVDMGNDYKTMDSSYTESVWWVFKSIFDKGLIYEGFKSMHLCPRCGTTLSNFEVNQGYADIKDWAVTVKLELENEPNTFLLVWTTTAWTLPGNMAAAVNPDILYTKIKTAGGIFILARERLQEIFAGETHEVLEEFKGDKLLGKKYKPPFDYYLDKDFKNKENAWKIYGADYVTTEDGTGIVHLAPAFGEEDLLLAQKENIPIVHHVNFEGLFTPEVKDFAGVPAKPKGNPKETDGKIIDALGDKVFKKEEITHSYPLCWRCETPLLNYAATSWFVAVSKFKDELVEENKKINWVPREIGEHRFSNMLESAPDWAISRSRYWGAPLPVWRCEACGELSAFGSLKELRKKTDKGNKYFVMRHGEAESNTLGILSGVPINPHHLTEKGRQESRKSLEAFKDKNINLIISSPFLRTKETAEIAAEIFGLGKSEIIFESGLSEVDFGELEGRSHLEYHDMFDNDRDRFEKAPKGGESLSQVRKRVGKTIYEIEKNNTGRNILIIAHETVSWLLLSLAKGEHKEQILGRKEDKKVDFIRNAEVKPFDFSFIPHNKDYELDFHRPYIDGVVFPCACGKEMKRVPEVFDCWFESGSMPYGQFHYPFENKEKFEPEKERGFPADFIAEGVDQTRGWFYSLLVLSTALFGKSPYKNVVVNGLVLAENGKKMSKRLNNYPDPTNLVQKYGADALRFYLLSSPAVRAESLNFSEKGVDEVSKKIITRLINVVSFYELYAGGIVAETGADKRKNVLDIWIETRMKELATEVSSAMDNFELDRACRPLSAFVDDLSTWYLRRSRDRFKEGDDKKEVAETLRKTLLELSKILAPLMPFLSEAVYLKLKGTGGEESVHLEKWPHFKSLNGEDKKILKLMAQTRNLVSLALEARASAGLKVRQPLNFVRIKNKEGAENTGLPGLIKDEVNVKEVIYDAGIKDDVLLDTEVSLELKEEGQARDIIRFLQDMRKRAGLKPQDSIRLSVRTEESGRAVVNKFSGGIKKTANISEIIFGEDKGEDLELDGFSVSLKIIN